MDDKNGIEEKEGVNRNIVKDYTHETDNEDINYMLNLLHNLATDPEEIKKLEAEQEADQRFEAITRKLREEELENTKN